MKISDFGIGGYDDFHRTVRIESLSDAKSLERFLELEKQEIQESFKENGIGNYVINLFRGWDRGGKYGGIFVVFVPETPKTWKETVSDLKSIDRKSKKFDMPFILADQISRGEKQLDELTDKESRILKSMDLDGKYEYQAYLENYLNGFEK